MFVKLSLRNERCVDWYFRDMGSSLPMLKSLDINSDTIVCGEFEKFITSFPMLEELEMGTMKWEDFNVTVSSANLRSLSLHGSGIEGWDDFENPKSFSFDAPNLLFLNYSELVPEDYPVVNMGKLLEAHINLMVTDEQMKRVREPNHDLLEGDDEVLQFSNVVKLVNGTRNVQRLTLTSDTLEVLSQCCDSMPVFNNLKFLSVTSEEGRGWQAMPALLRNCPHLETIIIQDTEEDGYRLPRELFFSSTLVKLKLRSEHCVDWWWRRWFICSSFFSLPMLKSFDIDSELVLCGEIEDFIPSFPVLEELRMATVEWREPYVIVSRFVNPKSVSFDTPNLLSLSYYDLVAEDYPLVNMKKLVEATISLIVTDAQIKRLREPNNGELLEDGDEGDVVLHFGNVVKLINGIENVQTLSLTSDTLEVLSDQCCDAMPVFNNLKFLSVTSEEGRGWQAMPALLRNCPHLETIIIQ
uniref:FBD domain-containing protein n=1 Tax=Brassica oleracea var. oleracea TaxID=109376 RepID=A0A0D3C188_BRAOL